MKSTDHQTLPLIWFKGVAAVLRNVEERKVGPQRASDADTAMIVNI